MLSASTHNLRLVVAAAVARGISPTQLLPALGIDVTLLLDPDARVPVEPALRAWQRAAAMTGDPAFGLSASEQLQPGSLGALGYAIHGSATLGEGLRRLAAFLRLVNPHARLLLVEDGDAARLQIETDHDSSPDELRHPVECLVAGLLRIARRTTGETMAAERVSFRHSAPADNAPHRRVFGVAPAFGQPVSELVFPRRALDLPTLAPDGAIVSSLERHLRDQLSKLPVEDDIVSRARAALLLELRRGEPELGRLAERLRMSERTLQRRLEQKGTSLRALVDGVRRELAMKHLGEPRESIAEIAFLLGFAEVSAFHRAFKRWTGSTPAAYRAACRGELRVAC
jgi:AraC-like DNA-binding protein